MNHFTPAALTRLRDHYTRMADCGPLQRSTMRALVRACEDIALEQLAGAEIPHLSEMAMGEREQRTVTRPETPSQPVAFGGRYQSG